MLMDVEFSEDRSLNPILSIIGGGKKTTRISEGMYLCGHWNFGDTVANEHEDYPMLPDDLSDFGVCDSPEQWKEKYASLIANPDRRFAVSFVEIVKADQSPTGGWRWHKWGGYIGTKNPQHEYLYDEPDIERVYTFHVYEVKPLAPRMDILRAAVEAERMDGAMQGKVKFDLCGPRGRKSCTWLDPHMHMFQIDGESGFMMASQMPHGLWVENQRAVE